MILKQSEKQDRLQKLENLKKQNINAYPSDSIRNFSNKEIFDSFDKFKDHKIILVGRIVNKREHGKLSFINVKDATSKIQTAWQQDQLGKEKYKNTKNLDIADIVQITGKTFITHKGEKSILVTDYKILAKALQPLPEKWHGIKDEEARYRKRYLDILLNDDLKELLIKKSFFWNHIRSFLIQNGFLEVETPVLEATPGGADAEPFITHHNALDIDLFLRISMGELWQKRLMVAGFEKTFEIGRQFRNEGIDAEHLQDYTQMEFYMAYANYKDGMALVEKMMKEVIFKTFNSTHFKIKGFDVDLDQQWKKIDYVQSIIDKFNIDVLKADETDLIKKCQELKINIDNKAGKGRIIDSLWKQVRKEIAGPVFLVNHPVEVSPLAKRKQDNPQLVERFQVIIAGSELGNGYSELNDPIDQAARFSEQAELREAGDEEAQMHDEEFVEALEHGMPPTCGFGLSERVFAFFADKPVRECVIFPLLKPKKNTKVRLAVTVNEKKIDITKFNIPREKSWELLKNHVKDNVNLNHSREAEVILRALAKKIGEDEELWGAAGMLHDLDWEETGENKSKEHGLITAKYLQELGYPNTLINAIKSHNFDCNQDTQPSTNLDYAVRCGEMMTGLIYATALVRPDKKLETVKVKSIKKKLKDKAFAAKIDRDVINECEKLGLELEDFIETSLKAMQEISEEIGL